MAIKLRGDLKNLFLTGRRPKQQDFHDWLESFYHKTEDAIKTGGWQFRSFFKDLRAEGAAIATGGFTIIEIPPGVTHLKRVTVMGKGTGAPFPFTITTSMVYFSDKLLPALNGVPSTGNPMPSILFAHPLIGPGTVPPLNFTINSGVAQFAGTLDFTAIPKDIFLDFTRVRMLVLTIRITNGTFPNTALDPSYVYYGLEYE